uniref:Uncharacterized protein n=1 Tax=Meloidogyne enterolobii TaxID=390850 RepID=A0A6V7UTP9_MELEN|nr:unnamed protein product [Meloidogyne enterolobii]CAD2165418.1 unnamed protein product [Meloidogyne enterolobii]
MLWVLLLLSPIMLIAFHVVEDDESDIAIIYVIFYRNQVALKRIMI